MNFRHLLTSFILMTLLPVGSAWAGGAQGSPCIREASLIEHVCQGGSNDGQQCTVTPTTLVVPCAFSSDDCPGGTCVIDYTTSKVVTAKVTIMADEHTSTWLSPQTGLGPAVTFLVCVKKNGEHCFTETYVPPSPAQCEEDSVYMGLGVSCVTEFEVDGFNVDKEILKNNFQFYVPEGLCNPDGDFAQGLRDLFETTGIPVVTDFGASGGTDDHADDVTGSVMHFTAKIRFVSGVNSDTDLCPPVF